MQTWLLTSTITVSGIIAAIPSVAQTTISVPTDQSTRQEAPEATTSNPGSVSATETDRSTSPGSAEIIVTAQKRAERIQDVPIAITVIDATTFVKSGAKNLTELQGIAPGIYLAGGGSHGASPISIRGTAGSGTQLLDDPVAVYVNGVYQASNAFGGTALLDLGSIEVVRGPQGTLQGRNATAGAILFTTPDPGRSANGYARLSFADPIQVAAEAAVGGPITNTLGLRVAAGYNRERGWGVNSFNGKPIGGGEGFSARGTLRWQPGDRFDARLYVGHTSTRLEPALTRWAQTPFSSSPTGPLVVPGTATPTLPLPRDEQNRIAEEKVFALNRPNFERITDDYIALNASYEFDGVDVVSITGFNRTVMQGGTDSDGLARTDREGFNSMRLPSDNFSQELRLQSSGFGALRWLIGGYYSVQKQQMVFDIRNLQLTVADRRVTRNDADQDTRSYAVYGDATWAITPEIALIGGVRYTRETKDFELDQTIRNFDTGTVNGTPVTYRPAQAVFKNTTYRAKATYQPTRDLLFYLSYSTGFKSGGFNAFGTDPAFFPEKLRSAEAGIKADLLDRRATIALAAYSNRYDDLQLRVGVPTGGVAIANAANSKIYGFELEGTLRPVSALSLTANVSYTHARYNEFPTARNLLDQGPINASGNRLSRTPDWQYYLQGSFTPEISSTVNGLLEASWRWRSRIYLYQTDQTAFTVQGVPLGELGLRAGVTIEPQKMSITAFATNLTDARAVNGGTIGFSYPFVSFNKPRSIGIQLEKRF